MSRNSAAVRRKRKPVSKRANLTLVEAPTAAAALDGVSVSFEHDQKGRAKTLLQALLYEADKYPDLYLHLEPAIKSLTAETKRTTRSTREKIVLLLERAISMTLEELREDLLIPESDLRRFLDDLIGLGLVEQVESGRRIDPKKGRVEYLYKLTHTSPTADNYTAPGPASSATRAAMDSLHA